MHDGLATCNRYPDAADALQQRLAEMHKVLPEQIVLGCGSSEVLRMAANEFLVAGKRLVLAVPTFDLLARYARDNGAEVRAVALTPEHAHDLKAMLAQCDASTGLVYLCNPNNPTGNVTPRAELEEFLRKLPGSIPVIMDEAYHHYATGPSGFYASFLERPAGDPRLIVLRTFSKIYGLAGLRVGYAVAGAEMAQRLRRHRLQFGVNTVALRAAAAALEDSEYIRTCAKKNLDERTDFESHAIFRHLRIVDSQTNFIAMKVHRPLPEVIELFKKNGIVLGPAIPTMEQYVRVSIGGHDEMQEFWRVYDLLPPIGHMKPHQL
jgi:histidinol-phosphate aminotransferase